MTRAFSRQDFTAGVIAMLPVSLALVPFGLVCGVAAANARASVAAAFGLSAIVFSGAAQIIVTQLYAEQAPVAIIVATCFVIGLRLALYSAAIAPHVQKLPARWRNVLAFVVTDQVFAGSMQRFRESADKRRAASHFLGGGATLWVGWQVSDMAGYFAGNAIPAHWSLDFAVPLCFVALLAPLLRELPMIAAATFGAVCVVAFDALPMRLSVITAGLIGIAAGTAVELWRERRWR